MSELIAITYVGKPPGYNARCGGRIYEFEWQKSLGVGTKKDEVRPEDARRLARMKDRSTGRRVFFLDKKSDIIN